MLEEYPPTVRFVLRSRQKSEWQHFESRLNRHLDKMVRIYNTVEKDIVSL